MNIKLPRSRSWMAVAGMSFLVSAANAGDAAVVYDLTFFGTSGALINNPDVAALTDGDRVLAHFEVNLSSASFNGVGFSYDLDLPNCYLALPNGVRINAIGGEQLSVDDNGVGGSDRLTASMVFGGFEAETQLYAPGGGFLDSDDLGSMIGTSLSLFSVIGSFQFVSNTAGSVVFLTNSVSVTDGCSGGIGSVGTSYCSPAVPNSSGGSGTISAQGSSCAGDNALTLQATGLPTNSFGLFIVSTAQASIANPGGSQGVLCVGGSIGRFVGPGQTQSSGSSGAFSLSVDLTQVPTPLGFVSVTGGETWNFQAWVRDSVGGAATSNFTDGLEVTFN